ncbi:MAG: tetratricopeptide repeat protein [Cyclobacteriaceae bacterium]|nr:tetratricopeptide repeat protein [Cyclobacteriaceae bacterium]
MKSGRLISVFFLITLSGFVSLNGHAQKSVAQIFKSDRTLADECFAKGDILPALELYERLKKSGEDYLKLGRGYFIVKAYDRCLDAYSRAYSRSVTFSREDYSNAAEANLTLKNYQQAEYYFLKILETEPDNEWIQKKLWRISNMHYLYEDSIHFATRLLSINTTAAEWGGVTVDGGLLFLSNRDTGNPVKQIDATTGQAFFKLFEANEKPDTLLEGWSRLFGSPTLYKKAVNVQGNTGTFSLYANNRKMVYAATAATKNKYGIRPLGLYFAEWKEEKWQVSGGFPYNEKDFSIDDPHINEQGTVLYFSSDKHGGYGGKDIYRSEWVDNKWTQPVNLGPEINTPYDEAYPYLFNNELYFSSNGHAGMGGLDIFKIELRENAEPVNLGHPLNSPYDDFAISFAGERGTHGFISSNRKRGGLDDDVYEFDMDMQTYPFSISGIIKQMDHDWSDSSEVRVLRNARIRLVDTVRKAIVYETNSDQEGSFSLIIPYFSKYGIYVIDEDGVENMAVFEIPRQRKESTVHEIVVIKDIFQSLKN